MRSIYASMNDSAALIPSGVRAKLFVRHSIRPGVEGQKVEHNGEMIQIEAGLAGDYEMNLYCIILSLVNLSGV